jgi:hypothetical protein
MERTSWGRGGGNGVSERGGAGQRGAGIGCCCLRKVPESVRDQERRRGYPDLVWKVMDMFARRRADFTSRDS